MTNKDTMHRIALVVIQWASSTIDDTKALDKVREILTAKQVMASDGTLRPCHYCLVQVNKDHKPWCPYLHPHKPAATRRHTIRYRKPTKH